MVSQLWHGLGISSWLNRAVVVDSCLSTTAAPSSLRHMLHSIGLGNTTGRADGKRGIVPRVVIGFAGGGHGRHRLPAPAGVPPQLPATRAERGDNIARVVCFFAANLRPSVCRLSQPPPSPKSETRITDCPLHEWPSSSGMRAMPKYRLSAA